jgi:hypothetical protein
VIPARVVFADGNGIGVQLTIDVATRATLVAIAEGAPGEDGEVDELALPPEDTVQDDTGADTVQDEGEDAAAALDADFGASDEAETRDAETLDAETADPDTGTAQHVPAGDGGKNVYERLRGLTLVEQYKIARAGEMHERIALERIYGKQVWEQLLRNPRITAHEVARIARMGTLPRPQIEIIVGNGAWLGVPEVRRALLSNTRLSLEMIPRILRHLSRQELKLVPNQLAYPAAVRDAARRLLRTSIP